MLLFPELVASGKQTLYADWTTNYQLDSMEAGFRSDPDCDCISNLLEYAFGGHPGSPANDPFSDPPHEILPQISTTAADVPAVRTISFRRRTDAAQRGLAYRVESTTNPLEGDWTNVALPAASDTVPLDYAKLERVTFALPQTLNTPRTYYRGSRHPEWNGAGRAGAHRGKSLASSPGESLQLKLPVEAEDGLLQLILRHDPGDPKRTGEHIGERHALQSTESAP